MRNKKVFVQWMVVGTALYMASIYGMGFYKVLWNQFRAYMGDDKEMVDDWSWEGVENEAAVNELPPYQKKTVDDEWEKELREYSFVRHAKVPEVSPQRRDMLTAPREIPSVNASACKVYTTPLADG
uniref:NAD(P)H-quinone oxidoreductase subunit 5, chloroplastic n=2 Tax=Lygus hesperus TaxID=30085 RepID=A0A0A9YSF9_LYGHE